MVSRYWLKCFVGLGNLEARLIPIVEKCLLGISLGFLLISFLVGHLIDIIVLQFFLLRLIKLFMPS